MKPSRRNNGYELAAVVCLSLAMVFAGLLILLYTIGNRPDLTPFLRFIAPALMGVSLILALIGARKQRHV